MVKSKTKKDKPIFLETKKTRFYCELFGGIDGKQMIDKIKDKINKDIHLKELLKGSSIAFVLRIIGIIAGYIFTLLITRGYGAEAISTRCYKIIFDVKLLP